MSASGVEDLLNFLLLLPWVGTSGQPRREEFALIRQAGYEVVVNLAMPNSTHAVEDENDVVHALGMEYFHIPVEWEKATSGDLQRFFTVMDCLRGRKVFVHCAMNMRASVFLYLYRVLRLGADPQEAYADILEIWEPTPPWAEFIRRELGARPG